MRRHPRLVLVAASGGAAEGWVWSAGGSGAGGSRGGAVVVTEVCASSPRTDRIQAADSRPPEDVMLIRLLALFLVCALISLAADAQQKPAAPAQPQKPAAAAAPPQARPPDLEFESVPEPLKLPPGMNFGEVPGIAVNSKGNVFVFTRSNSAGGPAYGPTAAQLLEFGPKGEFIKEIGKGNFGWSFAHTVRVDKADNIWAVDKGSDMVIKFTPAGRVIEVYGRRKESSDEEAKPWEPVNPPLAHIDGLFRQPTDVAWDSQGNTYVSDGYVNSRVA